MLLSSQPNALVIITGDFNPTTAGLKAKDITQRNHLKQLVTFKTRDSGTLDWFMTNRPKLFTMSQLPKTASSDHYTILAKPINSLKHKPVINKIESRDMRDSAWRALGRWMTEKDWNIVMSATTAEDKLAVFLKDLNPAIDTFLPWRVIKKHPTDRPWITKKLKIWICKRQTAFIRGGKNSPYYKFWKNKVQREISKAKQHYCHSKVAEVDFTNCGKWWRQIKSLAGQDIQQEWYHQFLDENK